MNTSREMFRDRAYDFICGQLMRGELVPGQKLSEHRLAETCGISRTPIHGAILRLIEEGILYQVEKSGTYVADFSRADILSAYDLREAVETHELAKVIPKLSARDRRRLDAECEAMHDCLVALRNQTDRTPALETEFLNHDIAFHRIFLNAAGNPLATKVVLVAYQRNRFFGMLSRQHNLHNVAWAWYYHVKIAKAASCGDVAAAVEWMRIHIRRSQRDALARYAKALRQSVGRKTSRT